MKLMARKHVCALPRRNVAPTESHSDGQNVGYFSKTLWIVLLALGCSEPTLFIRTLRLLRGNSYLWCVHVVIYETPTTDHICRIRQVVEASTPMWTFEAGMRKATWEALSVLWHEADQQMAHSQYDHFPSRAEEGAEVMCYLLKIMTGLGASLIKWSWLMPWSEIWMKISRRSSFWESMRKNQARRSLS
jgi:hypothetical protein